MNRNKENLPVIAVIISIFAMLLALASWSRTETLLNPENERQVRALTQRVELEDIRDRISRVRDDIRQGADPQKIQTDITQIRRDLARNIERADNKTPFENIDRDLETLERGVRDGTADVLDVLSRILSALEEEIRLDEPSD